MDLIIVARQNTWSSSSFAGTPAVPKSLVGEHPPRNSKFSPVLKNDFWKMLKDFPFVFLVRVKWSLGGSMYLKESRSDHEARFGSIFSIHGTKKWVWKWMITEFYFHPFSCWIFHMSQHGWQIVDFKTSWKTFNIPFSLRIFKTVFLDLIDLNGLHIWYMWRYTIYVYKYVYHQLPSIIIYLYTVDVHDSCMIFYM